MTEYNSKESLRLDLMEIQKAQQIRIIKRLQDTLINTIYRLYVDPYLQKYVVQNDSNSEKSKNITTYQAIRARFDGIEKGQLCQLIIKEYKKEMILHNFIDQYEKTLKQIVAEERVEQPSELKEKTRKKGKIQASWEAQTWKKVISLLMLANHENPALETFRDMWNHIYPEYPLPINKPGRKQKDVYQEEDDEEEGESQEILLEKENYNSNKFNKESTCKNLSEFKEEQEQTKNIFESKNPNLCSVQNNDKKSSISFQLQNDCKQIEKNSICKNSNAFAESNQKKYQKINEVQQFQLNEDNESENICLECLQNNFSQSISPKKSLISNHLSQSDAYQNAIKDKQNQDILFKSQSQINLETTINNKPSKFIAHSQSNEIQNFKFISDTSNNNIKYSVSSLTSHQINPKTDLNTVCNHNDEDTISTMNTMRRITEIIKEHKTINVNHPNLLEDKSNQCSQQGETYSYKQSLQQNNQHLHNNSHHHSSINLLKDKSSSNNIIKDSFKSQQSIFKDISEKTNTLFPLNFQDHKFESQLNQQSLIEQYSSNKDISYLLQQPMNCITNSIQFLNNNNQLQLLQQHLTQMAQKTINIEQNSLLQNPFDDQAKDNSTQGCSCCDNQNSPKHNPKEIQNPVPLKSEKKAFLLHQNPENNKIQQQFELSLEDKASQIFLDNNISQVENQDRNYKNEKNKCAHLNNKVNGFQIAKCQQAINQQYVEKIAQLEAVILQQQEENKRGLEIQEQLKVENNLYRSYFQQQMINQNSLLTLLNSKQPSSQYISTQTSQQQQSSQQAVQQQQEQKNEQKKIINIQNPKQQQQQQQCKQSYLNSVNNNLYSSAPIDCSILQSLTSYQQQLFHSKLNHYQTLNNVQ